MKRALLIVSCLVALAVALSVFIPARTKLPPSITFPAGDSVILHRLTYGTNHVAQPGRAWLRVVPAFSRALVSHMIYGAKPVFRDLVTAEPSLVLWIENTACAQPSSGRAGSTWLMVADETGHAAGSRIIYSRRFWAGKSTVALSSWPRSSKQLTLRWFEGTGSVQGKLQGKLVGEWVVANPAWQPPKRWGTEPLPLTRTNGSLRCTLERVLFGLSTPGQRTLDAKGRHHKFALARAGEDPAAVLVPRFSADSPAEKWEVGSVLLRDVSGNQVRREPFWLQVDETCCSLSPALWLAGPWEVTLLAKRPVPFHLPVSESFPPEELVVFKDVELPGPGSVALDQELERNGARLRLTQFTLRAPQNLSEPWDAADASELRASLSRSPQATAHVDLAGVTDEHGQAHYPRSRGYSIAGSSDSMGLNYSFPTLPLDTRKLTIVFVVQRGREFIFHVKPEIASSPVRLP